MDRGKPLIMIIIAIMIALFVTALTYKWLHKLEKKKEEKPVLTQKIAVARFDLTWGTKITADMIKWAPFLKESVPKGYFTDTNTLTGRTMLYPVKTDEPILESKLAPETIKTGGVAAIIAPQKRAMAVRVDKVIGVSGFIHPGHRVDVLVTLRRAGKEIPPTTKTVLENILVLAAGTEMTYGGNKEKASEVDVITLEVTPEEGEKLALGATEGKILLALRNFGDKEDVFTEGVTVPALLDSYRGITPKAEGENKVKKRRVPYRRPVFSVELIKGSEKSKLTFRKR